MSKGTTIRALRVPDDVWSAAVAEFPSERGRSSGLSAELQGFVAFLAEDPERWKTAKAAAAERGVTPWQLVAEALTRLSAQ